MKNIIQKNQLAILVIALMLVTAGYLNYTANNTQESIYTSSLENSTSQDTRNADATLVNSDEVIQELSTISSNETKNNTIQEVSSTSTENTVNMQENTIQTNAQTKNITTDEYFTNSRLDRDKMYSQMLETYQKILEGNTISETQKAVATEEIAKINNTKNAIMISENLIKNKGFEECVIFVNDTSISIIVKTKELTQEQIAQIQNIIAREMNAEIENIHISNK